MIKSIEEKLGIHIDVEPAVESIGKEIKNKIKDSGAYLMFEFNVFQ